MTRVAAVGRSASKAAAAAAANAGALGTWTRARGGAGLNAARAGAGTIAGTADAKMATREMSGKAELPKFEYEVSKLYDTNYLDVPKLPLPEVKDTLKRYLETVRPVASDEEFENTKKLAEDFEAKHAAALQGELQRMNESPGYPYSYIEQFWDDMYLGGRFEIMVGSNPFYALPDEKDPSEMQGTRRAARLASAFVRWWLKVVNGELEADMERDKPCCMYGMGLVFGATRIPGVGRDSLGTNFDRKHIIVMRNHNFYRVDVIDENGDAISAENLEAVLEKVKAEADANPGDVSGDVGLLTGCERDFWAQARERLVKSSETNAATLAEIDDCLFGICLQDVDTSASVADRSDYFLHGRDGSNRWFDKHVIVPTTEGALGVNFDHTFGDGLTWNRMVSEAWADMHGAKPPGNFAPLREPSKTFEGSYKPLTWELSEENKADLKAAHEANIKLAGDVDTAVLDFQDFGKNRVKLMKMSPDAACQMAFQLAYARLHGQNATVYESCAMKSYFHGRTETIRTATAEMGNFIKVFDDASSTDEQKREAVLAAAAMHVNVAKGAKSASGPYQGVDRHMHAMKCVAQKNGLEIDLFKDPMYAKSSKWILSTSNVTAPFIQQFGFGAVVGDGYGLGYLTQADYIMVNITSYKSCAETDSAKMAEAITGVFRDFDKLFQE
ncbi:Carnitine O-palmitoyltransferase 2, mitochondrial [Hondaea fermentalgiana]|uniref:Carnitine O-palmitoyltransferase 2, mitochondrial n=1 Tax=Hondaea fermentalgiana TaxID=2315210 RepID=A0A2R5GDI1_9STRA|nr:Carnitine O-palmitoyltransferase 2, mitochondrial [Hondaea fermentalgiana]|eukprot:GBG25864.1 Carnitine O-palmitoyltransferase 2, mitochondrial [Hondaea fermentalgiana]